MKPPSRSSRGCRSPATNSRTQEAQIRHRGRPRRRNGHGEQPQSSTEPGRPAGVKKFRYVYDFADHSELVIQVEKALEAEPRVKYPRCVKPGPCLPAGSLRRRLGSGLPHIGPEPDPRRARGDAGVGRRRL